MTSHTLTVISDVLGWIYTISWSASFYGQMWEVAKLKSVEGLSLSYVLLNMSGYVFYSIYSSYGYFDPDSDLGVVDIQDLVFCYHGFCCMVFTVGQCFYYPKSKNKIDLWAKILATVLFTYITIYCFLTNVFDLFSPPKNLRTLDMLGYNKLVITLFKYSPQAYWNYQRKSTVGWNICNVLCDFTGGMFSFAQNLIDALNQEEGSSFSDGINFTKFSLGIITIIYDAVFIFQHYCLYRQNTIRDYQKQIDENEHQNDEDEKGQLTLGLQKSFGVSENIMNSQLNNQVSLTQSEYENFKTLLDKNNSVQINNNGSSKNVTENEHASSLEVVIENTSQ